MPQAGNDWFILRTSGRSTLVLAKSLEEDGFEVWTPVHTVSLQVKRTKQWKKIVLPLLPSFVFVRSKHLHDMLDLANMPVKPRRSPKPNDRHTQPAHRDFSVFHYLDQIPMISDRSLEALRVKELEVAPKSVAPMFPKGAKVRVKTGAFEGLKGKVERSERGFALVIFDDFRRPVKIATFLLNEDRAISAVRGLDEAA